MTSPVPSDLPVLPTVECPYCGVVVPDAGFCGACGAHLTAEGFRGSHRLHSYAAFPDEPVLRVSQVSTLFPHLSHRAKAPFCAALGAVISRLQNAENNNNIASVNLTASASDITDLNVGQATADYNKEQILIQIGTTVLAQSNTNAQTVLGLFR